MDSGMSNSFGMGGRAGGFLGGAGQNPNLNPNGADMFVGGNTNQNLYSANLGGRVTSLNPDQARHDSTNQMFYYK
jgi:hypothetical protein